MLVLQVVFQAAGRGFDSRLLYQIDQKARVSRPGPFYWVRQNPVWDGPIVYFFAAVKSIGL